MSDPKKKEEKKKSGFAWWFSRAKDAASLARGGAGAAGAAGAGTGAAGAAAANAAAIKGMGILLGVLALGGIGLSSHIKNKSERPKSARRVFDGRPMDKPDGPLPGEEKPYSSLGMVAVGDMASGKEAAAGAGEAGKAGDNEAGAQNAAGPDAAKAQGDQIAQAMASAQAQAAGAAAAGGGAAGRAAKLPGGRGLDLGKDSGGGQSSAHFGGAAGAGAGGGPGARADNGSGKISSFAKGGAQTSRTGALISQKANRARGFSARQLAGVSNDASAARTSMKGGGQTETSAAAVGKSFDGAGLSGQAITGAGGGVGGQGAAGGAGAVALGGGGGGGGGKKATGDGPNTCQAGTTWNGSSCVAVNDDNNEECDAAVGSQENAEGWKQGMEDGHVTVRDHRNATVSLSGATGCSKSTVHDHRNLDGSNKDPDQDKIDWAQKIMKIVAGLAVAQMFANLFAWTGASGALAAAIMGCGIALMGIGAQLLLDGRYLLGTMWTAIGALITYLAWTGSPNAKSQAQSVADNTGGGDWVGPPGGDGVTPGGGDWVGPPGGDGVTLGGGDSGPVDPYA